MLRRYGCWAVGLLLAAGGAPAWAQTTTPIPGQKGTGLQPVPEVRGQIVRVDPATGAVWIRTGTGKAAREQRYLTGKTTRFYGLDNKSLTNGLRYNGWTPGTNVWFQTAPDTLRGTTPGTAAGAGNMNLNYLRLTPTPAGGVRPAGAPGTVPPAAAPAGPGTRPPVE